MIQPEHMADLIVYVARQPPSICLNEVGHQPDLEPRLRALRPASARRR